MIMNNINELSVSNRTTQSKIIKNNGNMIFRLQDKEVTENGNVIADIGYDALSKVNVNVESGGGSTTWYAYVNINDENDIIYSDVENPIQDTTTLYSIYGNTIIPNGYDIDSESGNILIYKRDEEGMWETITYTRDSTKDTSNLMQNLQINASNIVNNTVFNTTSPFIGYKNVEFNKIPTFTIFSRTSGNSSYYPTYICVKSADINSGDFSYESEILHINNLPTDEIVWAIYGFASTLVVDNATYDSSTNQITITSDPEGTGEAWIAKYTNANKYSSIIYDEYCIYY